MAASLTGQLLVAEPALLDPNFRRTVVLVCDHDEDGAFGLVLNRPTEHKLSDALEESFSFETELWQGGPVQLDTLHFLHTHGAAIDGATEVLDGVFWGGSFESLVAQAGTEPPARFFAGYAGWSAGQLDEELEAGGWLVHPATARTVLDPDATLWRRILRSLGGEYALLANFPDNPRMN